MAEEEGSESVRDVVREHNSFSSRGEHQHDSIPPELSTHSREYSNPHPHDHHNGHGHSHEGMVGSHHRFVSSSHITSEEIQIRQIYPISPGMDMEEASYLLRTILSFKHYSQYAFAANHVRMQNFYALPARHRVMLQPNFIDKLEAIDSAIEKNALIAKRIARLGEQMYLEGMEVKMGGPIAPKQKYISFIDN